MARQINQAGLDLIKSFEGCRLTAYKAVPTEKYWTIGWGHYGADVTEGMTITQEKADKMLIIDMATYEGWVNTKAYCPIVDTLNDNQFSALVSFCYNCGVGSLDKLCQGRTAEQIAEAMPLYNKSGGKVLAGLVRRRAAEVELFNTPVKEVETMTKDEFKALFNECMAEYINTLASKDVSNWAKDEVAEAIELGITDGTRPGSYATREEVMLMTKRAVSK